MSCPLGVEQLMSCNQVTMEMQMECCKTAYAVTAPHVGHMLRISGVVNFKVRDSKDTIIATFRHSQKMFGRGSTTVTLVNAPPIVVKPKSFSSRSICLFENEQLVLRVKRDNLLGTKFIILAQNNEVIGTVKKSWGGDYNLVFPLDLDIRYKTGLLAVCIYEHNESRRRQD